MFISYLYTEFIIGIFKEKNQPNALYFVAPFSTKLEKVKERWRRVEDGKGKLKVFSRPMRCLACV